MYQIGVMNDSETVTLTQEGELDLKMIVVFSRGHATLHLAVSVSRSVRRSVTFLNSERFFITAPAQPSATGLRKNCAKITKNKRSRKFLHVPF